MSLAIVTSWRIHPRRYADFMAALPQAVAIHRRHGATVRVFQATAAGENSGIVNYVIETEDRHAWATFVDDSNTDEEWQTLIAQATASDSPAVIVGQTMNIEITPE